MHNDSFLRNDDCCWKDACLILGEVFLDVVWVSVAGSRLNVKYFDKDNETGLCHCRLFWQTSAQCDDLQSLRAKPLSILYFTKPCSVTFEGEEVSEKKI